MYKCCSRLSKTFQKCPQKSYSTEATLTTKPYTLHLLDSGPPKEATLTKADALKFYEELTTIRKMEGALDVLYKAKQILGFCHLYSGQEAVCVGTEAVLRPSDSVITTYRCHAWGYFHNNKKLEPVIGELLGKKCGAAKGKGGSMHIYGKNFYGGAAIVGAHVPVGAGIALAYKYRKMDGVCVTIYGDGASNSGQVYETFNMSKLWNLPVVFMCENNLYAMGTNIKRACAMPLFYRQSPFVPGLMMDGMDVLSVREAMRFAINYSASGQGPIVVEAQTYRYYGHSMSDPGTSYRSREEITSIRQSRDPIVHFKEQILGAKLATEEELKAIDKKTKDAVDAATKVAQADKPVGLEELTYDTYANDVIKDIRFVSPFKQAHHKVTGTPQNLK